MITHTNQTRALLSVQRKRSLGEIQQVKKAAIGQVTHQRKVTSVRGVVADVEWVEVQVAPVQKAPLREKKLRQTGERWPAFRVAFPSLNMIIP